MRNPVPVLIAQDVAGHKFTGEELITVSGKVYADLQKTELQRTHLHTHGHVNITSSEAWFAYSIHTNATQSKVNFLSQALRKLQNMQRKKREKQDVMQR